MMQGFGNGSRRSSNEWSRNEWGCLYFWGSPFRHNDCNDGSRCLFPHQLREYYYPWSKTTHFAKPLDLAAHNIYTINSYSFNFIYCPKSRKFEVLYGPFIRGRDSVNRLLIHRNRHNMYENIVLGYPYDGGLYYLLSRLNPAPPPQIKGHPYYEDLYGPDPLANQIWAVNLVVPFDNILLPPADEFLPDLSLYSSGDSYFNPDIRLRVNHIWDFKRDAQKIAHLLLQNTSIVNTLIANGLPTNEGTAQFILSSMIEQLRLALENNAVLVVGDGGSAVVDQVFRYVASDLTTKKVTANAPPTLTITSRTLRLINLDWQCKNFDSFVEIRQSKAISEYGIGVRKALTSAKGTKDLESELVRLMQKAFTSAEIARTAKGAFEVAGVGSNIAGVVPVAGSVASLIGIGSYLAQKAAEHKEKEYEWYLIGAKLREIELNNILRKRDTG